MTTDPRRRETYMHVSASPLSRGFSAEEIRIEDYIKAYSTTGKPPAPVPQEPTGDSERVALGLPGLFQPYIEDPSLLSPALATEGVSGASIASVASTITDSSKLPRIHAFQPLLGKEGDTYHNIAALPEYQNFSPEELRCYAYAGGVIFPPTPLPVDLPPIPLSTSAKSPTPPTVHPYFLNDGASTSFLEEASPSNGVSLYYQSISAAQRFERHCFEELRVGFLQAGREVDSAQLLGPAVAPSLSSGPSGPPLFGATTSGAFSQPHAVRPW